MLIWPLLLIALATGAMLFAEITSPIALPDEQATARLVFFIILGTGLLVAALGRIIMHRGWRTVHYGLVWSCVCAALLMAHSYRTDLHATVSRLGAKPLPTVALSRTVYEAELSRAWDGHYRAESVVNGVAMPLMIDTGSSMVLLPYEHASAIGIDPDTLEYSMPVMTANGRSTVAPIEIDSIRIGPIRVENIAAAVAHPGTLKTGLLGMSFLDRMGETSFQGDRLFLRQAVPARPPVRTATDHR